MYLISMLMPSINIDECSEGISGCSLQYSNTIRIGINLALITKLDLVTPSIHYNG